jgi:hypothetical protein
MSGAPSDFPVKIDEVRVHSLERGVQGWPDYSLISRKPCAGESGEAYSQYRCLLTIDLFLLAGTTFRGAASPHKGLLPGLAFQSFVAPRHMFTQIARPEFLLAIGTRP